MSGLISKYKEFMWDIINHPNQVKQSVQKIDELKILTAKRLIDQMKKRGIYGSLQEAEFKVFSQFGDDGIIQYLINNVAINDTKFIELGVEKYTECNTRFLLINNNWSGLVIDGSPANVNYIKNDDIYWKYDLNAEAAFVTRDNINQIMVKNNFIGEIGLLSIDLDGNDYWIWESITVVQPTMVILEYNSAFGRDNAVTIPYDPDFTRLKAHFSGLYWGASLKAMCLLSQKKGYSFVGSNSNGNNAYFVRTEKIGNLAPVTVTEGYVESRFRESRDKYGRLTYLAGKDRLKLIEDMEVYHVEKNRMVTLKNP